MLLVKGRPSWADKHWGNARPIKATACYHMLIYQDRESVMTALIPWIASWNRWWNSHPRPAEYQSSFDSLGFSCSSFSAAKTWTLDHGL